MTFKKSHISGVKRQCSTNNLLCEEKPDELLKMTLNFTWFLSLFRLNLFCHLFHFFFGKKITECKVYM